MAPTTGEVTELVTKGADRWEVGRKQLTLAFGGVYIASTTATAKPLLVWETEQGYPRYYIPTESLHADIKLALGGSAKSNVKVVQVDSVASPDSTSQAIIETLTIGSKTTTWVRYTDGPLKDYIRFERSELDDWFENGAIFAGIKNPYKRIDTVAVSHDIVVKVDGVAVAESQAAVLLNETRLPETYYLPATSILDWGAVEKSDLKTVCPYKGEAWYLSLTVKGKKHENLVWYYQYPTHESAALQGFISFYNKENVEILLDGVKI